jgi:hypothetical protein
MPLLDQFRRPDRGTSPPVKNERRAENPPQDVKNPGSTSAALAEEDLPNDADEEEG